MSDYGKLMSSIWNDKKFIALNDREQKIYMMLFSFPTRNLAGVLPLTIRRWAKCSADANMANVKAALLVLAQKRFIIIDLDTEEVLIRTYIRNDEVWKQPNLMTRCLRYCEAVASERLKAEIAIELQRCVQELMPEEKDGQKKIKEATALMAKELEERFGGTFVEPSQEALFDTFGEPPGDSPSSPPPPPPPPAPAPVTNPPSGGSQGVALVEEKSTELAIVEDEKPTKDKNARRLAEDWRPDDDVIQKMKSRYPTIELWDEFLKFQNHHIGKGTRWVDWNRAWWNWVAGAAERLGVAKGRGGAGGSVPTSDLRVLQGEALKQKLRNGDRS